MEKIKNKESINKKPKMKERYRRKGKREEINMKRMKGTDK